QPLALEHAERPFEIPARLLGAGAEPGAPPGPFLELRLRQRTLGQLRSLGEVTLRLLVRPERGCALARPGALRARPRPRLGSVRSVRRRVERGQVVRGDDLDGLVLERRALEERSGGEVPRLAVGLRQRVVGDLAEQILEEAVLPVLGRAGVGLEPEDLLP